MAYATVNFPLSDLLQEVYIALEQAKSYLATGGSTTSIVSTNISANYTDGAFIGQTAFISRDAGGAKAAPEGEFQKVTAYTASTSTLTTAAFTTAPANGDRFLLARGSLYPLQDMIQIVNKRLKKFGAVEQMDSTSLSTASNQTEYSIPLALKGLVYDVVIQGITTDANDNQWRRIPWSKIPATSGSSETLVIDQYAPSYALGLLYNGIHADVSAFDDPITEYIPRELVVAACALEVANSKSTTRPEVISKLIDRQNRALAFSPLKAPEVKTRWFRSNG